MPDRKLPLLCPVRHKTPDLFSIDINSISLKDSRQHLEHPFFGLDTKPDTVIRTYSDANGNQITITPSVLGRPTIFDKDVLIYAISHIMHAKNRGDPIARRVLIYSADLLRFANKGVSGKDYDRLEKAILRLRGCTIQTNIRTGDVEQTNIFGILESASLERKYDPKGRLQHCEITLSEWLWRAIQSREVLTLHPDYFRIRSSLARRIYEIARKHCGQQQSWSIKIPLLYGKSASLSPLPLFRHKIRKLAETNALPQYALQFDPAKDLATFRYRDYVKRSKDPSGSLTPTVYRKACKLAPNQDIRELHRCWLAWRQKYNLPEPRYPAAAFLGFTKAHLDRVQQATITGHEPPTADSETINPKALAWWTHLPEHTRDDYDQRHRVYRIQTNDYFRSDKQLIEYSYRCHGPLNPR